MPSLIHQRVCMCVYVNGPMNNSYHVPVPFRTHVNKFPYNRQVCKTRTKSNHPLFLHRTFLTHSFGPLRQIVHSYKMATIIIIRSMLLFIFRYWISGNKIFVSFISFSFSLFYLYQTDACRISVCKNVSDLFYHCKFETPFLSLKTNKRERRATISSLAKHVLRITSHLQIYAPMLYNFRVHISNWVNNTAELSLATV